MNQNDLSTTIAGIIAGIATLLAAFNIVIPQWLSGAIAAIALAVLGYFTNKVKPTG